MKKIIYFTLVLFIAVSLTSCKTYDTKFKSPQDTILYIVRSNGDANRKDRVYFYLNGKKVAEIMDRKYIALHLKPGKYSARWEVFSPSGEKLADLDYGSEVFKAGVAYGCAINCRFQKWRAPFKYFDKNIQGAILVDPDAKREEIDLRDTIKPQKV